VAEALKTHLVGVGFRIHGRLPYTAPAADWKASGAWTMPGGIAHALSMSQT
jgi:hypothetical protein